MYKINFAYEAKEMTYNDFMSGFAYAFDNEEFLTKEEKKAKVSKLYEKVTGKKAPVSSEKKATKKQGA